MTSLSSSTAASMRVCLYCAALTFRLFRDFRVGVLGPERLVFPNHGFHPHQIDDALEIRFRSKRQLNTDRTAADLGFDFLDAAMEIGAGLIHLIDEHDARHVVFFGLAPDGLGLRLHALVAVEDADGAVKHPERALDFDREIDMAGRVDDVEALAVPICRGRGGSDRDASLLLLLHPIHCGGAVMDFAHLMRFAGVIENPLRRRRFARIDMGHDAEVPVIFDRMAAGHDTFPSGEALSLSLLPTIMRKRAVCFRHAMRVFPLLDRITAVIGGIHKLRR